MEKEDINEYKKEELSTIEVYTKDKEICARNLLNGISMEVLFHTMLDEYGRTPLLHELFNEYSRRYDLQLQPLYAEEDEEDNDDDGEPTAYIKIYAKDFYILNHLAHRMRIPKKYVVCDMVDYLL